MNPCISGLLIRRLWILSPPGRQDSDRTCHIFLQSNGCYLPLFRQFTRQQQTARVRELRRAASVLQFSGAEYYHWLLESLPRLLLLRQEVEHLQAIEGPLEMDLLIPDVPHGYIAESLDLLFPGFQQPGVGRAQMHLPFARIVPVAPTAITAVKELFYVDWVSHSHASAVQVSPIRCRGEGSCY